LEPLTAEQGLQHRLEIADAELGVAEELGWTLAFFAGLSAYFAWDKWYVALAIFVGAYVLAIYRYRRRASVAEDEYYRVAHLGKYVRHAERTASEPIEGA